MSAPYPSPTVVAGLVRSIGRRAPGRRPPRIVGTLATAAFCCLAPPAWARQSPPDPPGGVASVVVGPLQGPSSVEEGESVSFSVTVDDPSGEPATFDWDFGDGKTLSDEGLWAVSHEFLEEEGEYDVSVTVTAAGGGGQTRRLSLEVTNARPTIRLLEALTEPIRPGEPARFQAAAVDPGDDELTYAWDFGDGSGPRAGVDLRDVTHVYAEPGYRTLTLTVTDEDGLETARELRVGVNPGFLGRMAGEVPEITFAGESGQAGLLNALGLVPGISSGIPLGGGVADLSDAMGVCIINAGFWDDENQAHVNFQLTVSPERLHRRLTYPLGWEHPDDTVAPDQLLINAMVLQIDDTYGSAKEGAESGQIFSGGLSGLMDMLGGALGGALGGLFGGRPSLGAGRNWQLTAYAGQLTLTRVTPAVIEGTLGAHLGGAWMDAGGSGETDYVEVDGAFAFELNEVARANLLRCSERPFQVDSHTPEPEEKGVDFVLPRIRISFSEPFDEATIDERSIEIGTLSPSGELETVAGRFTFSSDRLTTFFEPDEPLRTGIYHLVRVHGGTGGVLSEDGVPLEDDYRFRFATVLRAVPLARGAS